MASYRSIVLAQRPKELIVLGETFAIKEAPMLRETDLKAGQILVKTQYLSLDPAMRAWLNDVPTYMPPVQIGEVMRGPSIGKIVASTEPGYDVGTYVTCNPGWTELAIMDAKDATPIDVPKNGRVTDALGALGFPGLTAYFGILDIGQVKAGDFVVVSGAAGATGSIVCQIAKLKGARVLGIAGSDEKVEWLKELGCDDALNYKDVNFAKQFQEKTSDLIDVFWDNVGGEILDLALRKAKPYARFVMCGSISQYNSSDPIGPKNITLVAPRRIKLQGFLVFDYASQFPNARKELSQWLLDGKLQSRETIIKGGLNAAEQGLIDLYNGINTGKLLVEVTVDE
ncbi:hypothetical protein BKA61DRAFT_544116 [Leptodontidium sp. MPI-SDFR-AT-0119]|nr:hypothetical protein BKA61DRAFT_544116 [Leptodontidium sp. MPI-SDFR-AT-0119]